MALGTAELQTTLLDSQFRSQLSKLEKDVKASFTRMGAASDGIIDNRASANVKQLEAALKPLQAALRTTASEGAKVGDGLSTGAVKAKRELTPLQKAILGLKNEVASYRNVVEATDVSNADAVKNFDRLKTSARQLADGLDVTTKEYRDLTGVAATASRSMKTLDGQQTRLGFSGNTVVGISRAMGSQFGTLQRSILPLVGVAGLGGLVKLTGSFVGEAQRAQSAAVLFDKSIERFGLNAGTANDLVGRLSEQFGILPSNVQSAATVMLRAGGSLEDVDKALTAAGASAAASGFDIGTAFENVGQAVATGRSELLESSGIITNASTAYKDYADAIGVSVDSLTQAQKVEALSAAIYQESRFEIEDLDDVLTDQVKTQQAFRTSLAEARQELGTKFAPTLTLGTQAAVGLLDSFGKLPDGAQASVVGIGGVTTGVAALATGLTALRPLLAATFLPPAGLIVLGVAAAAALGTAMYTLGNGALKGAAAEVDNLKTSLQESADGFATAKAAVIELQGVTDENGFLGVVETLASALDEKGASSLRAFAESTALPLIAQGELQKALELTVEKFGVFEAEAARAGLQGAEQQIELSRNRVNLLEREIAYLKQLTNGDFAYAGLNPTPSDIQALSNYEGQLVSVKTQMQTSQVAADGYRGQLKTVQDAQASLNDESLTSEQRLAGFAEALGLAAGFSADAGKKVKEITEPVKEVGNGAEDSGKKVGELTDELEKLDPALRSLVSAQGEYQKSRIDGILQAETSALRATLTAQSEYYDSRIEGARLASEASAKAATQATQDGETEQRAFFDRAKSRDAIVEANERAAESASVYDDAAQTVYTTQDAAIGQNERSIASLRDVIQAQEDWNERLKLAGDTSMTAAEAQGVLVRTLESNLASAYKVAITQAGLFGEAQDETAIKAGVARQKLEELLSQGLKPTDARVQAAAAEFRRLTAEIDAQTKAEERAVEAKKKIQGAVENANQAVKDEGDLVGQTSKELKVYVQEIDRMLAALRELQRVNPKLAEKLGVGKSIDGLIDAREGAEGLRIEIGKLADTKGKLALLGEGFSALGAGIKGLGGGNTAAGIFAGLGAGLSAAAGEVENINAGLKAIGDGDFSGGIQGLLGAAQVVLGAIKEAAEQVFGDDLPAAASVGFTAVEGALGGAAAGAVFGPWGAVIGGVLGGISGLFTGITAEQEEMRAAQEEITAEAIESRNAYYDLAKAIGSGVVDTQTDLFDTKLQFAVDSGQINEEFAKIKQAKIDIIDAYYDFQDAQADIIDKQNQLNSDLVAGTISQGEYDAQMGVLNGQLAQLEEGLAYSVGSYLATAEQAAEELGLSQEELYTALLSGDDAVLGQLGPGATLALTQSLQAYIDTFGALPPEMQKVADELGIAFDPVAQGIANGGQQITTASQTAGANSSTAIAEYTNGLLAALGPAAQPIIDQINALYNSQAAAHTQGGALTSQATQQGLSAFSLQDYTGQLIAQFGPAAQGIVDQINALYGAQAGAHGQGGTLAAQGVSSGYTAQSGALYSSISAAQADLAYGKTQLTGDIYSLYSAQQGQFLSGAGIVGSSIGDAADAQNVNQQAAIKNLTDYMRATQKGLLGDIGLHATDEAALFFQGGKNVQRAFTDMQGDKAEVVSQNAGRYITFLGGVATSVFDAARGVFDAEAAGFSGQGRPASAKKQSFADFSKWFGNRVSFGGDKNYETIPDEGRGGYVVEDPNETKVSEPKKGSISYADKKLADLRDRYADETDPKKRREIANQIRAIEKERDKLDILNPKPPSNNYNPKIGSPGKAYKPPKGGGSYKPPKGGGSYKPPKGGSKNDGSTYRGGKPENYPTGSPGWIQAKINEVEEQIKKTSSKTKIRSLQAAKEKLEAQLDALLGNTRGGASGTVDKPALKGSIDYLQEQIQKEQGKFDSATNDAARAKSAERLKILKAELEEKQAILRDAEREIDETLGNTVITIESPLADLSSIISLSGAAAQVSAAVGRTASASAASQTFSAQGSTLPAYQKQLDATDGMDSHVSDFGGHVSRFGGWVTRLERIDSQQQRPNSNLVGKARGQSLSVFNLTR